MSVVAFTGQTFGEVPVGQVLENAKHLKIALVIGETEEGEVYVASSTGDATWMLMGVERFKHWLMGELA